MSGRVEVESSSGIGVSTILFIVLLTLKILLAVDVVTVEQLSRIPFSCFGILVDGAMGWVWVFLSPVIVAIVLAVAWCLILIPIGLLIAWLKWRS